MVEPHSVPSLVCRCLALKGRGELHAGLGVQHSLHTAGTGQRLAHLHDEVCQFDQLHQDLVHVVHQRDHIAGGHAAHIDLDAAHIEQSHDGQIDDDIGQRAHQGGDVAHMELHPGQQVVGRLKAVDLALLLIKGADHAHTGQVLAGQAQHTVQPGLGRFVQRVGDDHDPEHHHAQQRDGDHKDPGGPHIHGERHDHGTNHHERAAQEQAQEEVQTALHLIDVTGHAGDEGAGAHGIHLGKAKPLDVLKQSMAQGGGIAHRRLGREILGRQAAGKAHNGQQQQDAAPHKDIVEIMCCNAHVDDVCHDQRHKQVERGFQHLEQRCKHSLALVAVQVGKHFIQGVILLSQ